MFLVHLKTLEEQFRHEQKTNGNEVDRWVDEVKTPKNNNKETKTELRQPLKMVAAEGVDKQLV